MVRSSSTRKKPPGMSARSSANTTRRPGHPATQAGPPGRPATLPPAPHEARAACARLPGNCHCFPNELSDIKTSEWHLSRHRNTWASSDDAPVRRRLPSV